MPLDASKIMKMAIEDVVKVDKLRDEYGGEAEGFRSRARSVPGLILDSGMIPAYTFVLSKSDLPLNLLNKLKEYFEGDSKLELSNEEREKLKEELGSGEGSGYGLISILMTLRMRDIVKEFGVEIQSKDFLELTVELAEKLLENDKMRISTEKYLLMYLEELKKLVDAYYKAKWKGESK